MPTVTFLTQRIVSEIEAAPEPVQAEVLDFVLFVKARAGFSGEASEILNSPRQSWNGDRGRGNGMNP
jgi:hypothetical protein